MSYVLTDFRPYLLNWQIPDTSSFTAANGIYPVDNDNQVNTDVTLVWPSVDGAESYLLQVTTTNFFSPFLEVMVEDTSYALSNLNLLTTYRAGVPSQLALATPAHLTVTVTFLERLDMRQRWI